MSVIRECQVMNCRHKETHTTHYHTCGSCDCRGHGQMECGNINMIHKLENFKNDKLHLSKWCKVPGCDEQSTHSSISHICKKCKRRHNEEDCVIQSFEYYKNKIQNNDVIDRFRYDDFIDHHLYDTNYILQLYIDMDHSLFLRCNNGLLDCMFMHGDSWGQYGESEDLKIYREFSNGYTVSNTDSYLRPSPEWGTPYQSDTDNEFDNEIDNNDENMIKCPVCRTDNDESHIHIIYSSEEECKICLTNKVNRFFSECGHACICNVCLETLQQGVN
tara:strand:+ start:93 stop:914 length:822 start_codon:yes stop_codon:yes gene_type:complete